MAIRTMLYIFFGLVLAGIIFSVSSVLILFYEFMPTAVLVFFTICYLAVCLVTGSLAVRHFRTNLDETASPRKATAGYSIGLLLPLATAGGSLFLMALSALPYWGLPRAASEEISDISHGNFATFMVDGKSYAYDFDASRLFRWRLTQTNNSEEIVSRGPFIHYYRRIVGTEGKEFQINIPQRHRSADIFITPNAKQIYYEVTYAKEENGVWRKSLDGEEEPERYAEFGGELLWTPDMRWTFLRTGRGLEKVDAVGNPQVLVPAPEGYSVAGPTMSPDNQRIAFVLKSAHREGQSKVCVTDFEGVVTEIFVAQPYAAVKEPQWTNDGNEVGFLYTPPDNNEKAVRTIAVATSDGSSSRILRRFKPGSMLTHPGVADFCWSPDDSRVVLLGSFGASLLTDEGGGSSHKFDLYVMDRDGHNFRRLTKLKQQMKKFSNGFPVVWLHSEEHESLP